jgi:propionyl-CoA synthetase
VADALKGQVPVGFVVLKQGADVAADQLERELIAMVRAQLGAVASFKRAIVVQRLPKTRSGKILRRTMRSIADGEPFATPSTIEEPEVLAELAATIGKVAGTLRVP